MAFILGRQTDGPYDPEHRHWKRYVAYLRRNRRRFPPGAYALATSDWYFDFDDHRAPHDSWLEEEVVSEPSSGKRHEVREVSIRVRLLGAYHDKTLEFHYPRVFAYSLGVPRAECGHSDWRYDEFRLNRAGHLMHEIEWAAGGRWLIEASDVVFTSSDRGAA